MLSPLGSDLTRL
jgi:hypothetical protein